MQVIPHDINVTDAYGVIFTVILPENATGMINVTWCSKTEQFDVEIIGRKENGTLILDFLNDVFPTGEYNATFAYLGDDCYNNSTLNSTSNILKLNFTPVITTNETSLIVNVPDDATGDISVTIDNKTSISPIINGIAEFDISDIPSGDYNATVTYAGDETYNGFDEVVSVSFGNFIISVDDLTKYYGGSEALIVNVTDDTGKASAGKTVAITINGVLYERITDENGTAKLNINLPSGEYPVYVSIKNNTVNATVTILTTVNGSDITKVYKDNTTYNATFLDSQGNYLQDGTEVQFNINGKFYKINISGDKGLARLNVDLPVDKYLVTAINPVTGENTVNNITIIKAESDLNVTVNGSKINVEVSKDATGNITITIDNKTFTSPINDGIAEFDLSDIPSGDYNATVKYDGDDNYNGFEKIVPISIGGETQVEYDNLTKYYHGSERFTVKVRDSKGNPIANQSLQITINGVTYNRNTDENGTASLAINLNSGEYVTTIVVNNMTFDAIVTVIPTINATDLEKVVLSDRQFYSTFRDSEGNYLKDGTKVKFNVNGITYEHQVYGGEGLAELDINLIQGEYIITSINPITGEMASNNIVVFPRIIENYDITKYFRNGTVFSVKIVDDDCKVAGAGIEVTYNINGVFYTRLTDENGIARLNITLPPGDYIITSECKGCKVSNNVKVLPVLIGEDVVMKYGDGTKFEMKLLDGQGNPFPNQKLKFNVYGVLNEAITDSNGIACVPITLQPGLYLMTTNYSTNGATTSNTILITS